MVDTTSAERMAKLYEQMGGRDAVRTDVMAAASWRRRRLDAVFDSAYKRYLEATPSMGERVARWQANNAVADEQNRQTTEANARWAEVGFSG